MKTLGFYNTRYYDYKNDSLKKLPMELSEKDRKIFFCDFKTVSEPELLSDTNLDVMALLEHTHVRSWLTDNRIKLKF